MINLLNRITKLEEAVSNIVRFGVIKEVNTAENLVIVSFGAELETPYLPYVVNSSGNAKVYFVPKVGDQVVIVSAKGQVNQAVVMPSIYKGNVEGGVDEWRLEFSQGSIIYKDGKLEIKASTEVSLDAEKVILNGEDGGGVVGGNNICAFTGTPHPQCSKKVFVGG